MSITIIAIFITYILVLLWMGGKFYKKDSSHAEYILGGRSLGVWVSALSAQASDMSGWILLGLPGLAYLTGSGASEAAWTAIGLAVGTYLNWLIVAKRLRIYSHHASDAITIPDYLEKRFGDTSHVLRMVAALFTIVFFLIYTASGFAAGAKLLNNVFGVGYTRGLIFAAAVILIYTFLGGFSAVCWTDLFQGILMIFAVVLVPFMAMGAMGNLNILDHLRTISLLPDGTAQSFSTLGIVSALVWGVGYFGQPHILIRFMAIKDAKLIRPARIIAMIWVCLALLFAILIGVVGRAFLPPLAAGRQEDVFMELIKTTLSGNGLAAFGSVLSWCVAGVFLSAILAAIMSTADSQLLVTASAVSQDVFRTLYKKEAGERLLVNVSRITVVVVTVIATLIASDQNSSVFGIVQYAWAGFGATFGPIILISLFWRRVNLTGAIAGVVTGGVVVLVWKNLAAIVGMFSGIEASSVVLPDFLRVYELLPGFILSGIAIVIVTLLTKEPDKTITDTFDTVQIELMTK